MTWSKRSITNSAAKATTDDVRTRILPQTMDWIGAIVSVVTGILLWYFLPRGVVLTRGRKSEGLRGEELHDSWEIRNASSLPIVIVSARVHSPATWNAKSKTFDQPDLPLHGSPEGVVMRFDDEVTEIRREDLQQAWKGLVVEAGDTLTAIVPTNTSLVIEYRRRGFGGVLERRRVQIDGGA